MQAVIEQPTYDIYGKNRLECALEIVNTNRMIKKINTQTFTVKSQSGYGVYVVSKNGNTFTCNCPDHLLNHTDCKHILAVKQLLAEQDTSADKTKKTNRNWGLYTLGQVNEEELVKIYLRQLVDTVTTPRKSTGRPSTPLSDLLFCSVMKVYGGKSSRRAHTHAREMTDAHLLEYTPNFNAVNKCLAREDITPILHHLIRVSALPLAEIENSFSIDSSGFATTQFNEWCDTKHGKKYTDKKGDTIKHSREHQWLKCHISSGNLTNVVADVVVTDNNLTDTEQFPTLLDNTTGYFNVHEVCADKAYSSRKNYAKADELGVVPYILFKNNASPSPKGCGLWSQAFAEFMTHHDEYMEHYLKRNNVESTFGAIKAKMGEKLRSKTRVAQENELLCKILAYNLTVLASAFFVHDVEAEF